MTSYTAPNGTTFSTASELVLVREGGVPDLRSRLVSVPLADIVAYVMQLSLTAVHPVPGAPADATVGQALVALGKVARWDVNRTSGENEK